jgi:FKBP-type peptidyl-prolyl cis-trans isomerase
MNPLRLVCAGLAAAAFTLLPTQLMAQSALEKGKAFLAENAKKEGVKTTPSGLQYIVITEGTGKSPKATDVVLVHYRGTLLDGTEFDSSYKRNQPISFPLNQVIPGWTEGVQLMKEGAKYKFFIPSNLAYGPRGAGGVIGPDETLIFEVELLKVQ